MSLLCRTLCTACLFLIVVGRLKYGRPFFFQWWMSVLSVLRAIVDLSCLSESIVTLAWAFDMLVYYWIDLAMHDANQAKGRTSLRCFCSILRHMLWRFVVLTRTNPIAFQNVPMLRNWGRSPHQWSTSMNILLPLSSVSYSLCSLLPGFRPSLVRIPSAIVADQAQTNQEDGSMLLCLWMQIPTGIHPRGCLLRPFCFWLCGRLFMRTIASREAQHWRRVAEWLLPWRYRHVLYHLSCSFPQCRILSKVIISIKALPSNMHTVAPLYY